VAVIGVGSMGAEHARVYAALPEAELVAVADLSVERATSVADRFGCRAYTDYREMLARERLEAVSIAVPTGAHHQVGLDVLRSGLPILMEKPLARTFDQGQELVEAAQRAGLGLVVGHVERFNPVVQELKRQILDGALGVPTLIVARRVGVMPPRVKDADVILDLAVHDIDVALFLLDRMPTAVAASASPALLSDRYDHSEILLNFDGVGCFIQANWITPIKIRTLAVTGTAGHAELDYLTQRLEIFESQVVGKVDASGDLLLEFDPRQRLTVPPIETREPLRLELECFLAGLRGQTAGGVSGQEGLRALTVVDWVKRAAAESSFAPPVALGGRRRRSLR
jgi:UDP-N-acetylglucosamine 3-dehydrogenase